MRWIPAHSSNFSVRSSRTITRVIIHTVEGSEGGCIGWFQNPKSNVSAHYVVSHAGRITQMVANKDIGWHAGNWSYNQTAIGIENEGYAGKNNWTQVQYERLAWLTRWLCNTYGIPKDRQHIIGHVEVPNQSHWDPGPNFNWTKFMNLVKSGGGSGGGSQPSPSPAPAASGSGISVTASTLNVRSAVWGTILGQVHSGDKFAVAGNSQGWNKIWWRGRTAWVHAGYTKAYSGTAEEVTVSALNVRTGPSTGYAIIGVSSNGQRYVRLGLSGAWANIQFDARKAWFHSGYTKSVTLK